jgi:tetratricopeptide (TPR) repeat protein
MGAVLVAVSGCSRQGTPAGGTSTAAAPATSQAAVPRGARPINLPDLSSVQASVGAQITERDATITALRSKPEATDGEKAEAFGSLGMLLHAGEFYEAAEPAYLNAEDLAPDDIRWPYLLGHLHKSRGEPDKALTDFTRALELKPDDVPTLIWLGRLYLDHGEPAKAQPLFERSRSLRPDVVAGIVGLGQAALAQKDYSRAVDVLEEALRVHPTGASVHSPLAMAYRGLGNTAKAEEHLKQWKNTEVLVPDPIRQQLDLSLQSGLSFELRGVRALEARDYKAAENFFRQGIPLAPGDTMLGRSLRHKLATALALQGDVSGAFDAFKEVVALAPQEGPDETAAKAHYSLGVLMASAGRGREAITHLQAAVKFNPNYLEARQGLGDALSRAGQVEAALAQYAEVVRLNPRAADARFNHAMALVRLGRYLEARDLLAEATRALPDDLQLRHALARLLAAAPDPGARDGQQALSIVNELMTPRQDDPPEVQAGRRTTQVGETLAMAYAEVGNFAEAASVQRSILSAASQAGLNPDVRRMTANLRLYERGQACRTPWQPNEAVFSPGPPISPDLRALLASKPPVRSARN